MKICGIICEFNPLHNGHEYLIMQAKAQGYTVVCLMSGNFTQRGIPARINKYERAKNAIDAGASIVLELPFVYAVNSADEFSFGAIKILKALKIDTIIFGSESGDINQLYKLAELKVKESQEFKSKLKSYLEKGMSYNNAYINAMSDITSDKTLQKLASSPNDILASSYIAEIIKQKANITPIIIKRKDNGYNSNTPNNRFLSASSILELEKQNMDFSTYLPPYSTQSLKTSPLFSYEKLYSILSYKVTHTKTNELKNIFGVSEGLENLLIKSIQTSTTWEDCLNLMVSKRYRKSRINKLLLYVISNLSDRDYKEIKKSKPIVKVLAVKNSNKKLLSAFKNSNIKLITTNKDYSKVTKAQQLSINYDLSASNTYLICTGNKTNQDKLVGTLFIK